MRIGIDIGGTKISGILWDKKVIRKIRYPTKKGRKEIVGIVNKILKELNNKKVKHIGIGIPLPFINKYKLDQSFKKYKILNDSHAFALASATMGAAKNKKNVVGLIIGTGIGSGIVYNKQLLTKITGEIGKIHTSPFSAKNYENQFSGPALEKMYTELTGEKKKLDEINKLKNTASKQVKEFANMGVAYLCSIYANTINPDIIVIGGGVSNILDYKKVNSLLKKYTYMTSTTVVKNKLGDDAGVIGAAIA